MMLPMVMKSWSEIQPEGVDLYIDTVTKGPYHPLTRCRADKPSPLIQSQSLWCDIGQTARDGPRPEATAYLDQLANHLHLYTYTIAGCEELVAA